jgi:hypothetical protein
MSDRERFELEGVTYYQQFRKCGKSSCRVCRLGRGHGPYWYSRDKETKKRQYIGKELPPQVGRARVACQRMRSEMLDVRQRLMEQYEAMSDLFHSERLTERQEEIVTALGFGECLVSYRVKAGENGHKKPIERTLRELGYKPLPGC